MENSPVVGITQRVPHLVEETHGRLPMPGSAIESDPEVPALDESHDQVGSVTVTPVVVQRVDVGMVQLCYELCVRFEAANKSRVSGHASSHDLDGDFPARRVLLGPVDGGEAAFAR